MNRKVPMMLPTRIFRRRLPVILAASLLMAGCAVGPDYERPAIDLSSAWPFTASQELATQPLRKADTAGERWWSMYADPLLDRLIDEALEQNADARIAAARVLEARALAKVTDSNLYPPVSAGFNANRTKSSELGSYPLGTLPRIQNDHVATLDVSYEIDLWGKYRRASEAARAQLFAVESAREAVRLSLIAQVAQQYFALLASDAQVAVTQRLLTTRTETLDLFTRRRQAGTLSEYLLHQAVAEQAATRGQLAALRQTQQRNESTLAVLLGRSPRQIMESGMERGNPPPVKDLVIPAGLPSDLLLRRPDLQEAEQQLIAANALIGAARAQYFPSLGLTGYLGSESTSFSELFSSPAGTFLFAAGLTQPIWNAGRITAGVEASEAVRDQALAAYQKAVANAFKDVRDALAAQNAAREILDAETTRAVALDKALKQARLRFDAGIASHLEVLDVERNLLLAELVRIDSERARKAALADMFKALGGGWKAPLQNKND